MTKEINPEDNRKKVVEITEKGLEIQKIDGGINDEIEEKIKKEFGESELDELKIKLSELNN